jgi:hypothetical protein
MAKNLMGQALPPGNGGVTYPSPKEWPITVFAITAINNATQAQVTAPGHGITLNPPNNSIPKVDFTQVKGMQQINGQFAFVTNVIDVNNINVALDTSQYYAYTGGGFLNITGGSPPDDPLTNTFP